MERLPELPEAEAGPFLRAIKATPEDDTPRLVFADWLDERGDPRGEMVRWSCELARTPHGTPEWSTLYERQLPWAEDGTMLRAWVPDDGSPRLRATGVYRGLIRLDVDEEADGVRSLYPNIFSAIEQGWVETAVFRGPISRLLEDEWKQELRRALAQSGATWTISYNFPHSGWVPDWYEGEEPWTDDDFLRGASQIPNLSSVGVDDGTFTDQALAHLRGHPGLRWLYLHGEFTRVGLSDLGTLAAFEEADVAWFRGVGAGDVAALAGLGRIRKLTIGLEDLSDEGFLSFAGLRGLRELLCYTPNRVTSQAIEALQAVLPNCRLRNHG